MDRRGTQRGLQIVPARQSGTDRLTAVVRETRGRVAQLVERVEAVAHFTAGGQSDMAMRILDAVRVNLIALGLDLETAVEERDASEPAAEDSSSARTAR